MNLTKLKTISKIIGAGGILSLALVATIIGGSRAAQQFAKASTCAAQKVAAVQVTANSVVVSWETVDVSQGRIEYGTNANNLAFSAPEGSSGKTHNVPLTLLTPNTVYYYLVAIGNNRCDSSGQACTSNCVPWSFTTATVTTAPVASATSAMQPTQAPTIAPTKSVNPATPASASSATPTAGLSSFCQEVNRQVQLNLGVSSSATNWATLKQYDINNDNKLSGLDTIKCQQSGK